ncbi:nSTAND1 domain-containing NTPase [Streptomyces beihaiensis]|uniref:Trypsin-like peptidase domain-containing protein n=1 Tax=Streptomyces beihaiensis TaxID=2984495 RepID=A0ABT3TVF3_9ACTN|nr:trypsin-like peptidase domain-containing protein [Streptomyces beihaiensis]MCX3060765.1 trypsin-like peptidase domain-containing protein [Streptomyces beihaiensis]
MVTVTHGRDTGEAEPSLVAATVRVKGPDGTIGGAGFLVAPDLVVTCAHVVSDALRLRREDPVGPGTAVTIDLPLAGSGDGVAAGDHEAEVEHWVPIRPDQTGDVAVLRTRNPVAGARPLTMADTPRGFWGHESRAVGFTDDNPDGIWHSGRFRGPTGQGWIQLARDDGESVYVQGGFSGSPVWDSELGSAVGMMVAAQPVREAQQAFVLPVRTLLADVPGLARLVTPTNPFRSLSTYQEDDADVFFGRNADVDRVVDALHGDRSTVTLYGPSGCGKSSLARAGVVPALRREGYLVLRVNAVHSASVRTALATELFEVARSGRYGAPRADNAAQVDGWLAELGLADTVHRALGTAAERVLVVLDQAEALLDRPEDVTRDTADLLFPERSRSGLRVLVTLRADFMNTALNHPVLGSALKRGLTVPLTPMAEDQLFEVITGPVARVPGVEYDPGLDQRILADAGAEPGALPLLGFVLHELWKDMTGGRLRSTAYDDLQGVSGALRLHAEHAWTACVEREPGDKTRAEALQLLTGLVRVLPGSTVPLRRLLTREEAGETRWRIATALADRRLLVLHGDEERTQSVELAHEALISVWPTLAEQVRADAEFLAGRAELAHDLDRWKTQDKSPQLLPQALHLALLDRRLRDREPELTSEERHFLALARRRDRLRRNGRRATWTAGVMALVLVAGLSVFLTQQSRARVQRAAEGRSRAVAVQSDTLAESNPVQAALAAIDAYEIAPTKEARSALLRRYMALRGAAWTLSGAQGEIAHTAMSGDGRVTLVTSDRGRATLFVRSAGGRVRLEQLRLGGNAEAPVISADGSTIAYLRDSDWKVFWSKVTPSGKKLVGAWHQLSAALKDVSAGVQDLDTKVMALSSNGHRLVSVPAADTKKPPKVWDLATGRVRTLPERVRGLTDVWFGPDANTIVATRDTGSTAHPTPSVVAVDVRTGRMRTLAPYTGSAANATVSTDGSLVVACRETDHGSDDWSAHYRAVRVSDGAVLRTYTDKGNCGSVAVDASGTRAALYDADDSDWVLLDIRHGGKAQRFLAPSPSTNSLVTDAPQLPLLGASDPVLVVPGSVAVTAWQMDQEGPQASTSPVLFDHGTKMVLRTGKRSETLNVAQTEGDQRTLASAKAGAVTEGSDTSQLEVNPAETLVADVAKGNVVTVRALPSLRRVAAFTTRKPPKGKKNAADSLSFTFLDDDQIVTASGTQMEVWDARTGKRLYRPVDLSRLRLTSVSDPSYAVGRHREHGYVAVTVAGDPAIHAVDPRTGKENKRLRIRLNRDLEAAVFLRNQNYIAVMTVGGMVELWSAPPGRPARRTAGPFGPLTTPGTWAAGGFGKTGFFLANDMAIRFYKADDPAYRDWYDFGRPSSESGDSLDFVATARGGTALLVVSENGGRSTLLRLDPARWKRALCGQLGRDLTPGERGGLPGTLPEHPCGR